VSAGSGYAAASVPQRYDDLYVPRLFTPWAELLLDRLALAPGEAMLDVACGPGSVTRRAAPRLGAAGRVVGMDLSAPMIAVARDKPAAGGAPIEYAVSPAVPLAAGDATFDVVSCQQGLQFFPDRAAAVAEMRRVLRPGGRVGIACWRPLEECPAFLAMCDGIDEIAPGTSAPFRAAFSFGDAGALGRLCEGAGLRQVRVERLELPFVFEAGMAQALTGVYALPVGPQIEALPPEQQRALCDAVARRLEPFVAGGEVRTPMASNLAIAYA
jgi:SAM-dependent methyltransferase